MAISKRTRYEVLARDKNTCRYCHATDTPLTMDHVVPTALGGSDDPSNLVAACKDCNAGKSSSNPDAALVAQVSDDAVRWAAAMQEAARRAANGRDSMRERTDAVAAYWDESVPSYKRDRPKFRLPLDWREAIDNLLTVGLPDAMIFDSIDVAMSRQNLDNVWRYMLGVAHNKLAKLQEVARSIVDEQPTSANGRQCPHCREWHQEPCGYWNGWRIGYVDCSVVSSDTAAAHGGHPDHYQMMALSQVVDRPAHEWAATWPYPSELYPTYSGRV